MPVLRSCRLRHCGVRTDQGAHSGSKALFAERARLIDASSYRGDYSRTRQATSAHGGIKHKAERSQAQSQTRQGKAKEKARCSGRPDRRGRRGLLIAVAETPPSAPRSFGRLPLEWRSRHLQLFASNSQVTFSRENQHLFVGLLRGMGACGRFGTKCHSACLLAVGGAPLLRHARLGVCL